MSGEHGAEPRYGDWLGASVLAGEPRTSTRFATWTSARECALQLYDEHGAARESHALAPLGDGLFELVLPAAGHGTLYKFVLDGRALPDPYARALPFGVHGPAMVVEPRYSFRFGRGLARPLREHVLYELHVGTFTEQGSYRAALARLPALVELGVTTLELMPVAAFAGARGWGYDGVAHFAPYAPYGTPDELREFVDEAHGLGLSVLLDVVYNHFGPAGNYLSAYHPAYFTREIQNPWGEAPDFRQPAMRAYVLANARYWLEQFRFDGLRLDAVHAIVDPSPKHILRELVEAVRALSPAKVLYAEDERNDPAIVSELGVDAVWADDFHHQLRVTLTGERDGYYASYQPGVDGLARAIERGWLYEGQSYPTSGRPRGKPARALSPEQLLYCMQNHDQIGNRALGERLNHDLELEAYCMASAILLFLPSVPLLFMGQEWAASSPFLFFSDHEPELGALISRGRREEFKHFRAFADPEARAKIADPQAFETFARSRLVWDEREQEPHLRVRALYRALLTLRRTDPVLCAPSRAGLGADALGGVLRVRRSAGANERLLLANFTRAPVALDALSLPAQRALLLSTAQSAGSAGAHAAQPALLAPNTAMIWAIS